MASEEFLVMPKMGESVMEATVISWLKKEGDLIEQDESVLEIATDKVDTEIPSTHAGVLKKILAKENAVVKVGNPVAIIETDNNPKQNDCPIDEQLSNQNEGVNEAEKIQTQTQNTFYSPLVKNIAKSEGISLKQLKQIKGTGKQNRVTKHDILNYIDNLDNEESHVKISKAFDISEKSHSNHSIDNSNSFSSVQDEVIEMDRMRRIISERMVDSKRISPHVTSFVEADVTSLVNWKNKIKLEFKQRESMNLTFTPMFIEAIAKAIKDFPMINVQVEGTKIIKKNQINIGMAVALSNGNLIVPVIKNADKYNLLGLSKFVNDLAFRARAGKLSADELSGGTYTMSNVGSFGNVMGTPIIMQPQVGIMAFGAISKKPSVVETSLGDVIAVRSKMFLSHSYDHRVVDGALGGSFVKRVAHYLEMFDLNTKI